MLSHHEITPKSSLNRTSTAKHNAERTQMEVTDDTDSTDLTDEAKRKRRDIRKQKRREKKRRKLEKERSLKEFNKNASLMRDVKSGQGDELKDKVIPKLNISAPMSESGEECRSSKKQLKKSRKSSIQPSQNSNIQRVNNVEFPTNEECTSLTISPSGRHIVAGFTDGTLRIFDTTGRFWSCTKIDSALPTDSHDRGTLKGTSKGLIDEEDISNLFDCDSDSESEISSAQKSRSPGRVKGGLVFSKSHQKYGAVACQIHARGVITSLLMDVQCSDDGRFVFGGVLRGSTDLVAVDLSNIEKYHDQFLSDRDDLSKETLGIKPDILDLIHVHRHSDAKLKGFGACIRLRNAKDNPEYMLFTGRGIKNMHIWSFIPPKQGYSQPTWQCLYDTPTNGNTISHLRFRYDSNGLLQGLSKSDDQKLRVWDLSFEQKTSEEHSTKVSVIKQLAKKASSEQQNTRSKRPPYIDVTSTEHALGIYGSYVFSGGDSMYNKMGVMAIDVPDIQSPFNHAEIALPGSVEVDSAFGSTRRSARSGRQQRGELKSVKSFAGYSKDADHVVLELSDGSLLHYSQLGSQPSLKVLAENKQIEHSNRCKKLCIENIDARKVTVLASSTYESDKNQGSIVLKFIKGKDPLDIRVPTGFSESLQAKEKYSFLHGESDIEGRSSKEKNLSKIEVESKCRKKKGNNLSISRLCKSGTGSNISGKENPKTKLNVESKRIESEDEPTKKSRNAGKMNIVRDEKRENGTRIRKISKEQESISLARKRSSAAIELLQSGKEKKTNVRKEIEPRNKLSQRSEKTFPSTEFKQIESQGLKKRPKLILRESKHNIVDKKLYSNRNSGKNEETLHQKEVQRKIQTENFPDKRRSASIIPDIKKKASKSTKVREEFNSGNNKETLHQKEVQRKIQTENFPDRRQSASIIPDIKKKSSKSTKVREEFNSGNNEEIIHQKEVQRKIQTENFSGRRQSASIIPDIKKKSSESTKVREEFNLKQGVTTISPKMSNVHNIENPKKLSCTESILSTPTKTLPQGVAVSPDTRSPETPEKKLSTPPTEDTVDGTKKETITKFLRPNNENSTVKTLKFSNAPGQDKKSTKHKTRIKVPASKAIERHGRKGVSKNIDKELIAATALCSFNETSKVQKRSRSISPVRSPTRERTEEKIIKERNELNDFLEKCHKRKRPKLLQTVPSLALRTGFPFYQSSGTFFPATETDKSTLTSTQDNARVKMAIHHRASHERLRDAIFASTDRVMNIVSAKDEIQGMTKREVLNYAHFSLDKELNDYKETLRDILSRQKMEAAALAATQRFQCGGLVVPELQVSFPFPESFTQARRAISHYFSET